MSIEIANDGPPSVEYVQTQIDIAEERIQAELERIAALAEFQSLTVGIDISTKRKLNAREVVDRVEVRIRAVI
ncbi:MAG: hypothetical protein AB7O64_18595 [Methylibium sp.]